MGTNREPTIPNDDYLFNVVSPKLFFVQFLLHFSSVASLLGAAAARLGFKMVGCGHGMVTHGPWECTIFKSSVHKGQGKIEIMNAKVEKNWPSYEPDLKSEMRWHKQQCVVQVRNSIKLVNTITSDGNSFDTTDQRLRDGVKKLHQTKKCYTFWDLKI